MMQPSVQNQDHQALLEAHLRTLGLPTFLQLYQVYARDAARNGLSPEQFLLGLCEAEAADRDAKRIETAIRRAKFPFIKELADYDFTAMENIPKTFILELALGGYMSRAENLILVGNPGLGKTHLGIGLALAACRQGKHVRFYKAASLINDLQVAQKKFSNLRFSEWNAIFADDRMTTAFLDRLTHKGRIVEFVGDSYRYRHRLQQDEPGKA